MSNQPKNSENGGRMKHEASYASLALEKSRQMVSNGAEGLKGMRITWRNLTYTVKSTKDKSDLQLVRGIDGFLEPGACTALMGPSGSGKTTLLDILAGRKTQGKIEGELLYGGVPPTKPFLRRYTGYVEQFDTLIPTLTVEEMLMYTAELKLPSSVSLAEKKKRVSELIKRLGLEVCRNRRIGSALQRGISGGQAKRVNIGIALVVDPRILFLDEPTTGLDSYTATEVMMAVKDVASLGVTVCATIHSPTEACFRLFDMLLLMLQGKTVYMGRTGRPAIDFFVESKLAFRPFSTEEDTEAEWIVNVSTYLNRQGDANKLVDYYENSSLKKWDEHELDELVKTASSDLTEDMRKALKGHRACETSFARQFMTLFKYRTIRNLTTPDWAMPRFADRIFISLVLVSLYTFVGHSVDRTKNVLNTTAVLFMWCVSAAFGASAVVPSLVLEKKLFSREMNDGLFYVITYLCHKIFEEVLITSLAALGYSPIVFFGLRLKGSFWFFWLHYCFGITVGILAAYFFAALAPSMDAANAMLPAYMVTQMFFSGFLIVRSTIPNYWYWYHIISFTSYQWMGLMQNNFQGTNAMLNDKQILKYYSIPDINPWAYTGLTAIFVFVFFWLTYIVLAFKKIENRAYGGGQGLSPQSGSNPTAGKFRRP